MEGRDVRVYAMYGEAKDQAAIAIGNENEKNPFEK